MYNAVEKSPLIPLFPSGVKVFRNGTIQDLEITIFLRPMKKDNLPVQAIWKNEEDPSLTYPQSDHTIRQLEFENQIAFTAKASYEEFNLYGRDAIPVVVKHCFECFLASLSESGLTLMVGPENATFDFELRVADMVKEERERIQNFTSLPWYKRIWYAIKKKI